MNGDELKAEVLRLDPEERADLAHMVLMSLDTAFVDKTPIIKQIYSSLSADDEDTARKIACKEYPFIPIPSGRRRITKADVTRVSIRDGFIDRYSGRRLIFPGALRLLSQLLPDEFPYSPNWKTDSCHAVYWEYCPTIDHVVPVARGGADDESNWVSTSQMRNSAKANWTLMELGWKMVPPGNMAEWDGQIHWFLAHAERNRAILQRRCLNEWYTAAKRGLEQVK